MERHRHYMIVMDRDGVFRKAQPISHGEIGAEVVYEPKESSRIHNFLFTGKSVNNRTKIAAMTVMLLLITFPLYAWYNGDTAYAYVNVDINPSMEMEVNEALKVKDIQPLNEDAEMILAELGDQWKNKTVEEVTAQVIDQGRKDQLIEGENVVIIGVSYLEGPLKDKHITKVLDEYFRDHPDEGLDVATFEVPEEIRKAANIQDKSMNQMFAEEVENDQSSPPADSKMDDQERDIIQSFYNKQSDHEIEESAGETDDTKPNAVKQKSNGKDNGNSNQPRVDSAQKANRDQHQKMMAAEKKAGQHSKLSKKEEKNSEPSKQKSAKLKKHKDKNSKGEQQENKQLKSKQKQEKQKNKNKHKQNKQKQNDGSNKHKRDKGKNHNKH
ncbi:hypothetical protein SAMN05216243_3354 [Sediminibacillus albus]|uniref:RsgI N-terminal anti-sigma domain-containing protein n=2 Tax=Sediminibacillus albus TaxID=407036 RepID=A0A1G9CB44_9BACI|nr:hypothetical protein SAMN05216243_3354 [Sediminibacillus albus]